MARGFFEQVTLGTFIVIILVAVGFWAWGRAESKGAETTEQDLIEGVVEEA